MGGLNDTARSVLLWSRSDSQLSVRKAEETVRRHKSAVEFAEMDLTMERARLADLETALREGGVDLLVEDEKIRAGRAGFIPAGSGS